MELVIQEMINVLNFLIWNLFIFPRISGLKLKYTVGYAGKNSEGVQCYGRPRRGSGGWAHPRAPENVRKVAKNFLRKLNKCRIFAYFAKEFQNPALNFRAFGRKTQLVWEIFRIFQKIPEENCKNCWIFDYFAKKLQNHALNFRAFGRKTQLVGEILRKFWKSLVKICC